MTILLLCRVYCCDFRLPSVALWKTLCLRHLMVVAHLSLEIWLIHQWTTLHTAFRRIWWYEAVFSPTGGFRAIWGATSLSGETPAWVLVILIASIHQRSNVAVLIFASSVRKPSVSLRTHIIVLDHITAKFAAFGYSWNLKADTESK